MYLECFFKEKAAGEKSLEEVVVDRRNVSQCGRSIRCAERGIRYVFE